MTFVSVAPDASLPETSKYATYVETTDSLSLPHKVDVRFTEAERTFEDGEHSKWRMVDCAFHGYLFHMQKDLSEEGYGYTSVKVYTPTADRSKFAPVPGMSTDFSGTKLTLSYAGYSGDFSAEEATMVAESWMKASEALRLFTMLMEHPKVAEFMG